MAKSNKAKKKSVKETPKYLKASIGIVYFYAMC